MTVMRVNIATVMPPDCEQCTCDTTPDCEEGEHCTCDATPDCEEYEHCTCDTATTLSNMLPMVHSIATQAQRAAMTGPKGSNKQVLDLRLALTEHVDQSVM